MRGRTWWAWVALLVAFALAGCLEPAEPAQPDAPEPNDGDPRRPPGDDAEDDEEDEEEPARTRLGKANGGDTLPGRIPFVVTVPEGGATDVEWVLVVQPIGTFDSVDGPGCSSGGSITYIGGPTEAYGSCSDLEPGDHEFFVVLGGPVRGYNAQVFGILAADADADATA